MLLYALICLEKFHTELKRDLQGVTGDNSETMEMTPIDMIFEPILEHGVFRFDCSVEHKIAAFPSVSFKNNKDREVPIISHTIPAYTPTFTCLQEQQLVIFEVSFVFFFFLVAISFLLQCQFLLI